MPQHVPELPVGSFILGFAMVGLRIGLRHGWYKLASDAAPQDRAGAHSRGHTFSLLVSAYDALSLQVVSRVPGIQVLRFQGPLYAGTEEWAASPQEVRFVVKPKQGACPQHVSNFLSHLHYTSQLAFACRALHTSRKCMQMWVLLGTCNGK